MCSEDQDEKGCMRWPERGEGEVREENHSERRKKKGGSWSNKMVTKITVTRGCIRETQTKMNHPPNKQRE